VASVLHLGNVQFAADEQGNAQVTTENQIKYLARVSINSWRSVAGKMNCRGFLILNSVPSCNLECDSEVCINLLLFDLNKIQILTSKPFN